MHDLAFKMAMKRKPPRTESKRVKTIIYLTPQAREVLTELRLRSLDKQGRVPDVSQVIEDLLKGSLKKQGTMVYPS